MKKVFLLLAVTAVVFTACESNANKTEGADIKMSDSTNAGSAESKTERNKKIMMASFDAMASHNVADMLKDCAADCVDYGDGSMPPVKSKDSIMKMISQWMNAFPDNKGNDLKFVADGDWVMVWGEWTGTFKNDFMGMKATNKSYKMKDVDIFKMNDAGQVIEHHNVQSPNTMMMQVGMMPPKK
jgi:predicted ester cyclase/predicted small secreted protein